MHVLFARLRNPEFALDMVYLLLQICSQLTLFIKHFPYQLNLWSESKISLVNNKIITNFPTIHAAPLKFIRVLKPF